MSEMEYHTNVSESFWDFRGQGEYTDNKLLMSTPFPVAATVLLYLWFVLKSGPNYMKDRKPYHLGNLLVLYNIVQVYISCHIFYLGYKFISKNGLWQSTCLCERDDVQNEILDGGHLYFLAKVVELLDTVFFVLRKKQRQVSFLHVYHHAMMVIVTWTIVKYNKTDSIVFIGTINSLIHIIMYGYYGLSVFPSLTKYLWWKRYITIMQLVQFTMMFLHVVINHFVSQCKPSYMLLGTVCSNTILFMYLFGDFYIKSYIKNLNTKDVVTVSKVTSSTSKQLASISNLINQNKLAGKMQ